MDAIAVVLQAPEKLELSRLTLAPQGAADVVVDIVYSGISTGTERLLWTGRQGFASSDASYRYPAASGNMTNVVFLIH